MLIKVILQSGDDENGNNLQKTDLIWFKSNLKNKNGLLKPWLDNGQDIASCEHIDQTVMHSEINISKNLPWTLNDIFITLDMEISEIFYHRLISADGLQKIKEYLSVIPNLVLDS